MTARDAYCQVMQLVRAVGHGSQRQQVCSRAPSRQGSSLAGQVLGRWAQCKWSKDNNLAVASVAGRQPVSMGGRSSDVHMLARQSARRQPLVLQLRQGCGCSTGRRRQADAALVTIMSGCADRPDRWRVVAGRCSSAGNERGRALGGSSHPGAASGSHGSIPGSTQGASRSSCRARCCQRPWSRVQVQSGPRSKKVGVDCP